MPRGNQFRWLFPDKKTVYLYRPDPNEEDETPLNVMAIHEAPISFC